ncbi:MAG TPA: glycoside hydrolase family 3 N-terminal domain-containing protein, partial [Candidatus Eisenbacteria bacterium]|nr:glycoside hydrolase family 3 N-terminal domain-containing protein [Candidatus Eisenbacteria bacterium]
MDTLRRLAEGCVLPGFAGTRPPGWVLARLERGLGGAVLFARNVAAPGQVAALTAELHGARPDALVAIDEEGGDVTRLEAAAGSSYPGNLALGTVNDLELTRAVAASLGAELAAAGIDLDLAPVADVNSNPDNPVIGVRSFGADPELVAAHTAAFVEGLQSAGVAACVKHFPGHGDTAVDSHLDLPVVAGGEGALEVALRPFRAAIAAGTRAVMTAHLVVPGL